VQTALYNFWLNGGGILLLGVAWAQIAFAQTLTLQWQSGLVAERRHCALNVAFAHPEGSLAVRAELPSGMRSDNLKSYSG
jgi:hypothetical protein